MGEPKIVGLHEFWLVSTSFCTEYIVNSILISFITQSHTSSSKATVRFSLGYLKIKLNDLHRPNGFLISVQNSKHTLCFVPFEQTQDGIYLPSLSVIFSFLHHVQIDSAPHNLWKLS